MELMLYSTCVQRDLGFCDKNMKSGSEPEEVFKFLRYLLVSRSLNDLDRFVLEFFYVSKVQS